MGILLSGQTRIKQRRRVMPLEVKMKLLEKLEEGVSSTDVGRLLGVSESTVHTIKRNAKAIGASQHGECVASVLQGAVHSPERKHREAGDAVNLLGGGQDRRGPASDTEGHLQPGQTHLQAAGGNRWEG